MKKSLETQMSVERKYVLQLAFCSVPTVRNNIWCWHMKALLRKAVCRTSNILLEAISRARHSSQSLLFDSLLGYQSSLTILNPLKPSAKWARSDDTASRPRCMQNKAGIHFSPERQEMNLTANQKMRACELRRSINQEMCFSKGEFVCSAYSISKGSPWC